MFAYQREVVQVCFNFIVKDFIFLLVAAFQISFSLILIEVLYARAGTVCYGKVVLMLWKKLGEDAKQERGGYGSTSGDGGKIWTDNRYIKAQKVKDSLWVFGLTDCILNSLFQIRLSGQSLIGSD